MTSTFKPKNAFTLAETLITLAIIGVIAALTVPNLLQKWEKQQAISGLKVAYSLLDNAVKSAIIEHGPLNDWDYRLSIEDFHKRYFFPYLKVTKTCNGGECEKTDDFYGYYEPGGAKYTQIAYSFVLANGMIVMHTRTYNLYAYMIDINGNKGPNRSARDIFTFYLFNHSSSPNFCNGTLPNYPSNLYPGGLDGCGIPYMLKDRNYVKNSSYRPCNKQNSPSYSQDWGGGGSACAALIIKDGWQIKDDYPW